MRPAPHLDVKHRSSEPRADSDPRGGGRRWLDVRPTGYTTRRTRNPTRRSSIAFELAFSHGDSVGRCVERHLRNDPERREQGEHHHDGESAHDQQCLLPPAEPAHPAFTESAQGGRTASSTRRAAGRRPRPRPCEEAYRRPTLNPFFSPFDLPGVHRVEMVARPSPRFNQIGRFASRECPTRTPGGRRRGLDVPPTGYTTRRTRNPTRGSSIAFEPSESLEKRAKASIRPRQFTGLLRVRLRTRRTLCTPHRCREARIAMERWSGDRC